MCARGRYVEKWVGVSDWLYGGEFCAGRWLSGVERGGHGKCCQMVSREVKRIRGRRGGVKIGASPVI